MEEEANSCLNCFHAEWYYTKNNRINPRKAGKCKYQLKIVIPKAFYYIGGNRMPSGGYIERSRPHTSCPTWEKDIKIGNYTLVSRINSEHGYAHYRLVAYLFWASLGLVFIGIGLCGYPIITVLFGFAVLVFSTIGYFIRKSGKPCKLFRLYFIDAMYDDAHDNTYDTNSNQCEPHDFNRWKKQNHDHAKNYHECQKYKPTFHATPPGGKR